MAEVGKDRQTADVLDEVASVLAKPGSWIQGAHERDGRYDLTGAILQAGVSLAHPAARAIQREIGDFLIWRWNDAPGRTHAEVIAAIRAARGA